MVWQIMGVGHLRPTPARSDEDRMRRIAREETVKVREELRQIVAAKVEEALQQRLKELS